ncbi:chorismate-binding protein [Streptomyces panaciradicis]|uniref:chorismate-binding protein n=1 Tax=Streptomyces panaciradicis TaxID=1470261 RepID=UPI00201CC392|nr:chorismate-binding protein [Streptomyces panaciradicis]MCL6674404.1 chorismate-binding protein [Streptomyces panaciradicis]
MRILLIDRHDAYPCNLFQLIAEVNGEEPVVVRDDATEAVPDLAAYLAEFDNVVVSPGPWHPAGPGGAGLGAAALAGPVVPVLGVCPELPGGAPGERGGAAPVPRPRAGRLSRVRHDGRDLFQGLPQDFTAVRHPSPAVREPLPETLEATAWSEDGEPLGLRHRGRPLWAVQFRPDSALTEYGHRIMVNFRNLTAVRARRPRTKNTAVTPAAAAIPTPAPTVVRPRRAMPAFRLHSRRIAGAVDTEAAFTRMYGASRRAFWLDGALAEEGLSRFSFLGDDSGPLAEFVRYDVDAGRCEIERAGRPTRKVTASVFDYLKRQLTSRRVDAAGLPFDFTAGYVGYFGYETKADCGSANRHSSELPDACWLFADRLIAVDHLKRFTYAVCLAEDTPQAAREAEDWLEGALAQLSFVATDTGRPPRHAPAAPGPDLGAAEPWLVRDRARYLADVEDCRRAVRAGTGHGIRLADTVRLPAPPDAYDFHRVLRRVDPAPYGAFLRFGDVDVAGSSPERFLRITRDGVAEARPVEGIAPRGDGPAEDAALRDAPAADAATRAGHLTTVDLLRNDLGRVCRTGSVRVTRLMATETYASVHQLVSTVEGRLKDGTDAVDCVRACFPGGSATGAPKQRATEVAEALETEARGVHSGALGYLGCGGGADLGIVERTAVFADGLLHLGAGSTIVLDSDPVAAYDEMLLKTAAPMRALREHTVERIREQRAESAVRQGRAGGGEGARR